MDTRIKIQNPTVYNDRFIHKAASLAAGAYYGGVKTGSYGTIILLAEDTPANVQTLVNNLFTAINTLPVITDKASITADEADTATITLVTAQSSIEYIVLLDGELYSEGTVVPAAGTATLSLATALPGTYTVICVNPDGSATGQVDIVASEV